MGESLLVSGEGEAVIERERRSGGK